MPTVDTIRYNYLVSGLIKKQRPVLLIGPVGTGKTSVAQSVLNELDPMEFGVLVINMSAQVFRFYPLFSFIFIIKIYYYK